MAKDTPKFYTKWWFWVIVAVIVVGVFAGGANKTDGPTKVGKDSSQTTSADENKAFKVGDVIALHGMEVSVTNVKRNWKAEYDKPKSGKEFIQITVKLENKTDDTVEYESMDWKVENSDGDIKDYEITMDDEGSSLGSGKLSAGGKKTGKLVFEVPKGDKNLKVHYKPIWEFFENSEATIEL